MNKRKSIALFTLAATAIAFTLPLSAQTVVIHDGFEVNYDGWTNHGDHTQLTAVSGAGYNSSRGMMVTGRKAPEDGAASDKGFYIDGGASYNYSVYVKHSGKSPETFNLTVNWRMPNSDTYESEVIATAAAQPNQWTLLAAAYSTPNGSVNPTFLINTNSTVDFYFDEFTATGRSASLAKIANTPADVGLKDIYANHFRVGNILNGTTANSTAIQNLIRLEYNSVTAENEHKPDATMARANSTNTNIRASFNTGAARIMDFCARNNIPMRGHVLFWHGQTPQWFFLQNINDNTDYRNSANSAIPWASTATMNSRIDSYTQNIFALYQSQYPALNLYAYDVVNEFVRVSGTAGPRLPGFDLEGAGGAGAAPGNSPWQAIYGNTNTSWVRTCFEAARRHAPAHTKLFYNDYNEFDPVKRDYIISTFLRPLYTAGLLDGMGMQGHISADPSTTHWSNLNRYREAMTRYASIGPGFEVQITELDVVTNQGNDTDNSNFLSNQPSVYRAIFEHAISINADPAMGNFTAICMWGPDDGNSWITRRAGRTNSAPLLHDRNLNRKPAYDAVAAVVPQSQWGDGNNPTFGGGEPIVIEPDANGHFFLHTFENNTVEGWQGRGDASVANTSAQAARGSRSLAVTGRTATWQGAAYSLNAQAFKPGSSYSFSVMARQNSGSATDIQLTMQYMLRDTTRYNQVAAGSANSGQWIQLANTDFPIPAGATELLLYVEMPLDSTGSFFIDDAMGGVAGALPPGGLTTSATSRKLAGSIAPSLAVRGRTLNINAPASSELRIRVIDVRGKTVASFNTQGGSKISLRKIPAGMYIIEAKGVKNGTRMVSQAVLK